jgi:hypothetical protein
LESKKMGASDYFVGSSPQGANYAAPLLGLQLGQSLASLPDQYMKGRQNAQQIALDNMFPNGLPKKEDGSPDIDEAFKTYMDQGAKITGGNFVKGFMPFLIDQASGKVAAQLARGEDPWSQSGAEAVTAPTSAPTSRAHNPNGTGPAHLGAEPVPLERPRLAENGGDIGNGPGQPTLRSMIAEWGGGNDVPAASINRIGMQLRTNPDAPLSPQKAAEAKAFLANAARPIGGRGGSEAVSPQPEDSGADERAMNGPAAAPEPAGGVSGTPGPNTAPVSGTARQSAAAGRTAAPLPANGVSGAPGPNAAPANGQGWRPTPVGSQEEARRAFTSAANKEKAAAYLAKMNPKGAEVYLAQAKADRERGEKILGAPGNTTSRRPNR